MKNFQFALGRITVPNLSLVTVETDEAADAAEIKGSVSIDFADCSKDDSDMEKKLVNCEMTVNLKTEIKISHLVMNIEIKGDVLIDNEDISIGDIKKDERIQKVILAPFLSKVTQITANLTSDNGAYPYIVPLNSDKWIKRIF
ncbi:MAG: hypothetical protein LBC56_01645 [Oscillospiraceae bacterium]|jgi:hypothetical protein|nr:hypothetical protein [Oscillospiraceae bacterium]